MRYLILISFSLMVGVSVFEAAAQSTKGTVCPNWMLILNDHKKDMADLKADYEYQLFQIKELEKAITAKHGVIGGLKVHAPTLRENIAQLTKEAEPLKQKLKMLKEAAAVTDKQMEEYELDFYGFKRNAVETDSRFSCREFDHLEWHNKYQKEANKLQALFRTYSKKKKNSSSKSKVNALANQHLQRIKSRAIRKQKIADQLRPQAEKDLAEKRKKDGRFLKFSASGVAQAKGSVDRLTKSIKQGESKLLEMKSNPAIKTADVLRLEDKIKSHKSELKEAEVYLQRSEASYNKDQKEFSELVLEKRIY